MSKRQTVEFLLKNGSSGRTRIRNIGEYLRDFKKLLSECLPKNLTPNELINYQSGNLLKIAEGFYKQRTFKISGYWAARAF